MKLSIIFTMVKNVFGMFFEGPSIERIFYNAICADAFDVFNFFRKRYNMNDPYTLMKTVIDATDTVEFLEIINKEYNIVMDDIV